MFFLVLIGFVAGIISGMGIGGGTILIPALILFIGSEQQTAQSINLLYFIPTAVVALLEHLKNKKIKKELLKGLIVGGILGAILGALLANVLNSDVLRKIFGVFLLVMGITELLKKEKK